MKKSINYQDGRITYYDTGKGDPIVLLHGYLESSEVWVDFIPGLAEEFRVIAIDLPGHGGSSIYTDNHSMDFMAEVVLNVLNAEGINKVLLTGHSMGGYVALAFVEKYQERLHAYCLFHSHPYADTDETIANRKREIKIVESGKMEVIYPVNIPRMFADFNTKRFIEELERHKQIASAIPADGIIAVLNGMIDRPSRLDVLEKGNIPLLIILGMYDNYIPFKMINDRIIVPDNAEVLALIKSGHLGFIEEREESQKAIINFYTDILK